MDERNISELPMQKVKPPRPWPRPGERNCGNCRFFEFVRSECHIKHPQLIDRETGWPTVCLSDWCGEWESKENEKKLENEPADWHKTGTPP